MNIGIIGSLSELDKIVVENSIATLVSLIKPFSSKLLIIAANYPKYEETNIRTVRLVKYGDQEEAFILFKLFHHLFTDLKLTLTLLGLRKEFAHIIYSIGAKVYPLSEVLAKVMRKRVIVFSFNPLSKVAKASRVGRSIIRNGAIPPAMMGLWDKIVLTIADHIWVESEALIDFSNLRRFQNKVSVCPTFYINPTEFRIERDLRDRENVIGFLGRLTEGKGILNFVKAIPIILSQHGEVEFVIGGEGPLRSKIEEEREKGNLREKVRFLGWVARDEVPHYLNQMKLFVFPSYTEGLPRAVQEAMACGAVVLATPVGAVLDLIKDGETGFILEDNSPECIAKNVISALNDPNLGNIAKTARALIEKEYTYEAVMERLNKSLGTLASLSSK